MLIVIYDYPHEVGLALDAQGPGEITGHEDHEALLTKTSLWREPGPAGIPTARARIASRAGGGLIVKLVCLPNPIVLQI